MPPLAGGPEAISFRDRWMWWYMARLNRLSWPCVLPGQQLPPVFDPADVGRINDTAWGHLLLHEILPQRQAAASNMEHGKMIQFISNHFREVREVKKQERRNVRNEKLRGANGTEYKRIRAAFTSHEQQLANQVQRMRIVEIGTGYGGGASALLRRMPNAEVCAIDPFEAGYDTNDPMSHKLHVAKARLSRVLAATKNHNEEPGFSSAFGHAMTFDLNGEFGCNYHLLPMPSITAAAFFNASSVDVLIIDGLHTAEGVHEDLVTWTPKLRDGGLIMVGEYGNPSRFPAVRRAVDEFAGGRRWQAGAASERGPFGYIRRPIPVISHVATPPPPT